MKRKLSSLITVMFMLLACFFATACGDKYKDLEFRVYYAFSSDSTEWFDGTNGISLNYDPDEMYVGGNRPSLIFDENGEAQIYIKIEIENDSLQRVQNTDILQAITANNNMTKLYSKDMKKICELNNATVEKKDDYIVIYNDNEKKYFNKEGKEVKNIEVYADNTLFSKVENNKWGFADENGNTVIEYQYDKVTEFNEYGFAAVKKRWKMGLNRYIR